MNEPEPMGVEPTVILQIGGVSVDVDASLAPIVQALNDAGVPTVASCSGHGHRPGNISLLDGREIFIARHFEDGRRIDRLFRISACGEPLAAPKCAGCRFFNGVNQRDRCLRYSMDTPVRGRVTLPVAAAWERTRWFGRIGIGLEKCGPEGQHWEAAPELRPPCAPDDDEGEDRERIAKRIRVFAGSLSDDERAMPAGQFLANRDDVLADAIVDGAPSR